jgi:hypothetical protein
MFFNSLFYNLVNPDDGSCELITTYQKCASEKSSLYTQSRKCYWADGGSCHFLEPRSNYRTMFITAIACAVLTVPVMLVLEFLFLHVLNIPTRVIPVQAKDTSGESMARDTKAPLPREGTLAKDSSEQQEAMDLLSSLLTYRLSLSEQARIKFDIAWGLDIPQVENYVACSIAADAIPRRFHTRHIGAVVSSSKGTAVKKSLVNLLSDLAEVRKAAQQEVNMMRSMDIETIRLRLLLLFQRDLLTTVSHYADKSQAEDRAGKKLSIDGRIKSAVWVGVVVFDIGLLFYSYLFAVRQSHDRQIAWIYSFITWLFLEICVVSTAVVFIGKFAIPFIFYNDIAATKKIVLEELDRYRSRLLQGSGICPPRASIKPQFDPCKYLFVSRRVALLFPMLNESAVISEFVMDTPRQPTRKTAEQSTAIKMKFRVTAIANSLSFLLVQLLGSISNLPKPVADQLYSVLNWSLFGYLGILVQRTLENRPYTLVAVVSIVAFIALPGVYYYLRGWERAKYIYFQSVTRSTRGSGRSVVVEKSIRAPSETNTPPISTSQIPLQTLRPQGKFRKVARAVEKITLARKALVRFMSVTSDFDEEKDENSSDQSYSSDCSDNPFDFDSDSSQSGEMGEGGGALCDAIAMSQNNRRADDLIRTQQHNLMQLQSMSFNDDNYAGKSMEPNFPVLHVASIDDSIFGSSSEGSGDNLQDSFHLPVDARVGIGYSLHPHPHPPTETESETPHDRLVRRFRLMESMTSMDSVPDHVVIRIPTYTHGNVENL